MKAFSFSDLNRRSGEVLDAALAEPVSLNKRGRPRIVMLPLEHYERLKDLARQRDEPTAFTLQTAPDEDIAALVAGFQDILDSEDDERR